ncbi:L-carnitine dehydratase/bile acid-inducible protein F [Sulfitobacter noctilucicola]|uniref:Alpha-methylacyl-CoA racemase n=1 Tax=Sulfitobacter noctilucicola TaxID=1342301 RepID=A0A7W6M5L1_9RHOB|nr:CaiB/BaiF CoA-transferase family protein [Sulfitobacter noctilucicola]KIN62955.1 L-carnitine dehydratase/bile acid-inducible protein F [Sulfitobacter noctilucicola]MBB4172518.1 alpha-methylacyl-CoA racemase [Sulfitobacter noctilucicola]
MSKGPLATLKVIEFSGLGPAPLVGQLLADLGADVVTIDREFAPADKTDINRRGKRSVVLNLKSDAGLSAARLLVAQGDVVIEGFRPGVMERLGLGPDACPDTVIYARMTGWGQDGPWSHTAGHDINYLALTGALHAMGDGGAPPVPPMNLVADYGGGTMFLIFGVLAAVIERGVSGKGQVVDAAMVDGVPAMMGLIYGMLAQGTWSEQRAQNWLDGAAPFYRCYTCADGKFVSVGALEPQFYAILLEKLHMPAEYAVTQNDRSTWAERTREFAEIFVRQSRDAWADLFEGTDACIAPVLTFSEAANHLHMAARKNLVRPDDVLQSATAPRFSRFNPSASQPVTGKGAETQSILEGLGLSAGEIAAASKKTP